MKKLRTLFMVLVLMAAITNTAPAKAVMEKKMEHGKASMGHHEMKYGKGGKMGHKTGHGPTHVFGPKWKETLTDSQKMQADQMHLIVMRSTSLLKAQVKLKKTELNLLVVKGNPDTKTIQGKIDEIMKLKGKIMKIKYIHMTEMRGILTPEQQVSFDMGLLKMTHGKGHKGRGSL